MILHNIYDILTKVESGHEGHLFFFFKFLSWFKYSWYGTFGMILHNIYDNLTKVESGHGEHLVEAVHGGLLEGAGGARPAPGMS